MQNLDSLNKKIETQSAMINENLKTILNSHQEMSQEVNNFKENIPQILQAIAGTNQNLAFSFKQIIQNISKDDQIEKVETELKKQKLLMNSIIKNFVEIKKLIGQEGNFSNTSLKNMGSSLEQKLEEQKILLNQFQGYECNLMSKLSETISEGMSNTEQNIESIRVNKIAELENGIQFSDNRNWWGVAALINQFLGHPAGG
jgi:hypothetical protein